MPDGWKAVAVALLAEGVDRNWNALPVLVTVWVALLAEGVDRNWQMGQPSTATFVALLAEGVDRNSIPQAGGSFIVDVALLAEGVDRNLLRLKHQAVSFCRPPRGGRG